MTTRGKRGMGTSSRISTRINATNDDLRLQQNKALIKAINKIAGTNELATDHKRNAVATINEAMGLVNECESDIKQLKSHPKKKRKCHPDNPTKTEKINIKYKEKINYQKSIINSLKKSIVT